MVVGLDKFRAHFRDVADQYVLIGGVATHLLLDEAGLVSRATKDLDIVLCLEAMNSRFVEKFWGFVESGGYQNQQASTGKKIFYRFQSPTSEGYPEMLELFSRQPDALSLPAGMHLTPIPVDEEVSSLSAILLDEGYYEFIHTHRQEIDGVPIVSEVCLIPLKAKAWLDLTARKDAGQEVKSTDIKKHRNDVLRLSQLIAPSRQLELPSNVGADLAQFLEQLPTQNIQLQGLGIQGVSLSDIALQLTNTFQIKALKA